MLFGQVEGALVVVDGSAAVRALVLDEVEAVILVLLVFVLVLAVVMMAAAAAILVLVLVVLLKDGFLQLAKVAVQLVDVALGLVLAVADGIELLGDEVQRPG